MEQYEFYDVKTREKVKILQQNLKKTRYERELKDGNTQVRFAIRADHDGRKLSKFCSKKEWETLTVPVE